MLFAEEIKFRIWLTIHTLPLQQIKLWQKRKAGQIIKHAFHTIPLYKKLWGFYRIGNKKSFTLEELPIINKRTFIDSTLEECIVRGLSKSYYKKFRYTAGSTGEPIQFIRAIYGDGSAEIEEKYFNAKQLRFLLWDTIPFKKIISSLKVLELGEGGENNTIRLFMPITKLRDNTKRCLQKIEEFGPDVITGYPAFILELAETVAKNESNYFIQVPYITMGGQTLKLEEQNFIKKALRSTIYTRYGFEEFRAVGIECKYHDGFHLHVESFIFEIVNDMGRPVPPGESGRIIITDLYNRMMPFVRYDTGDYGRIDETCCRCGLWAPRLFLEQIPESSLYFGRKRVSRGDTNKILGKYFKAITQYQIRKLSHNSMEVFVVTGVLFNESIAQKINREIKDLVGNNIKIKITQSKNILSSRGRQQIFLDLS